MVEWEESEAEFWEGAKRALGSEFEARRELTQQLHFQQYLAINGIMELS